MYNYRITNNKSPVIGLITLILRCFLKKKKKVLTWVFLSYPTCNFKFAVESLLCACRNHVYLACLKVALVGLCPLDCGVGVNK